MSKLSLLILTLYLLLSSFGDNISHSSNLELKERSPGSLTVLPVSDDSTSGSQNIKNSWRTSAFVHSPTKLADEKSVYKLPRTALSPPVWKPQSNSIERSSISREDPLSVLPSSSSATQPHVWQQNKPHSDFQEKSWDSSFLDGPPTSRKSFQAETFDFSEWRSSNDPLRGFPIRKTVVTTYSRYPLPQDTIVPQTHDPGPSSIWQPRDSEPPSANIWQPRDSEPPSANIWQLRNSEPPSANIWRPRDSEPPSANIWQPRDSEPPSVNIWQPRDSEPSSANIWHPRDPRPHSTNIWQPRDPIPSSANIWHPHNPRPHSISIWKPRDPEPSIIKLQQQSNPPRTFSWQQDPQSKVWTVRDHAARPYDSEPETQVITSTVHRTKIRPQRPRDPQPPPPPSAPVPPIKIIHINQPPTEKTVIIPVPSSSPRDTVFLQPPVRIPRPPDIYPVVYKPTISLEPSVLRIPYLRKRLKLVPKLIGKRSATPSKIQDLWLEVKRIAAKDQPAKTMKALKCLQRRFCDFIVQNSNLEKETCRQNKVEEPVSRVKSVVLTKTLRKLEEAILTATETGVCSKYQCEE
ncbi:uncharacterized protein LOC143227551 [Tachypleus tridentatus]|uniref:uncharacterized protein LOC143227551 n=1 Tax=Tachypleus tridentatus TaxID=6853 RepID=UPI003FD1311B